MPRSLRNGKVVSSSNMKLSASEKLVLRAWAPGVRVFKSVFTFINMRVAESDESVRLRTTTVSSLGCTRAFDPQVAEAMVRQTFGVSPDMSLLSLISWELPVASVSDLRRHMEQTRRPNRRTIYRAPTAMGCEPTVTVYSLPGQ